MMIDRSARMRQEQEHYRLVREFRQQLREGRFEPAFETGERLRALNPFSEPQEALSFPVDRSATGFSARWMHELLHRLEALPAGSWPEWRLHLRFALLDRLEFKEDAFAVADELAGVPERYGWMRYGRGVLLMNFHWNFKEAAADFEASLKVAPRFWKAEAYLAECALCLGREEEAFRIFDRCLARLPSDGLPKDEQMARVWRGELHLWMGRYREAIEDFAGDVNVTHLALGWRGAAYLKLGEVERALVDLDKAVAAAGFDAESLIWRGEAHAKLGHWPLALSDFDRAASMSGAPLWVLIGRGLVMAKTGDIAGLWRNYDMLPSRVTGFFEWKLGQEVGRNPAHAVAVMESVLEAAKGIRRGEHYLYNIWMRRQ